MQYSWTRTDGKPMPKSASFSDFNRVMTIPNIQLGHAGTYTCTVVRQLGKFTNGSINLKVEGELKTEIVFWLKKCLHLFYFSSAAPYFTIPLSDEHLDLNSDLVWQCKASGVPEVLYKWFVNSTLLDLTKLPPDVRTRYQVKGNRLTITKVQFRDAGMYQCAAENAHGTRFSSAQLRVLCKFNSGLNQCFLT